MSLCLGVQRRIVSHCLPVLCRQVSNFPERAEEYLSRADDIEDSVMARAQLEVESVRKLRLLSVADVLEIGHETVRLCNLDWAA